MELFALMAKLTLDAKDFYDEIDAAEKFAGGISIPTQKLNVDTKGFNEGIDQAREKGASFGSALKDIFHDVGGALLATGVTALITKLVNSLSEGIALATKTGEAIDKGSKKLHLSTDAYQKLDYALEQSGASIKDLSKGMDYFTSIATSKELTEDQQNAFDALGLSALDASGNIKDAQTMMMQSLYALADYKGDDRGSLISAIFGDKNGKNLELLLDKGSDGIRTLMKDAEELGLVMSADEVANAAAYTEATTKLHESIKSLETSLATGVIPLLTEAANSLAKIFAAFNWRSGSQSLEQQFAAIDKEGANALVSIDKEKNGALSLVEQLEKMGEYSQLTADQQKEWEAIAEKLIEKIPSLTEVINLDTGAIEGGTDALKQNIEQWAKLERQRAMSSAIEKKEQALIEANEEVINKRIEARQREADAVEARTEAYHKFSDEMESRGLGKLDFEGDVEKQVTDLMSTLAEGGDQYESDLAALGATLTKIGEANTAVATARAEAEEYEKQLAKAQDEFNSWKQAAMELFGGTEGSADQAKSAVDNLQAAIDNLPDEKNININVNQPEAFPQAKGNWNVPYDNYPSLLHRGEMVLTKSQARQYREGGSGGQDISGVVASAVNQAMSKVFILMNGEKVGDLTTKRVKRNINASSYSRLRALGG